VWIHRVETPACPACGGEMVFVFQSDSCLNEQDSIDVDGAHMGDGYLFLCRRSCGERGAALIWQYGD
jgi:hypothetical protein